MLRRKSSPSPASTPAGQVGGAKALKALGVDEQAADGHPTSTRCRFCGCEDDSLTADATREKEHIQVVVACGSCGHPFAILSRN
jgi:transcription elongation factor Elf1